MLKRLLNRTSTIPEVPITSMIAGQESLTQEAWRKFRSNRQAMLGAVVLLIIVLSVVFGPLIYSIRERLK
ncbi:hypothetical protein [Nostoc parmelioides]|uniref:hypothetical protein n=1 Tax=Nostoc parmelioides TaxID=1521621 RepID=UPI001F553ACA|nr:hypothetical protein [Nostoc parmelioides]